MHISPELKDALMRGERPLLPAEIVALAPNGHVGARVAVADPNSDVIMQVDEPGPYQLFLCGAGDTPEYRHERDPDLFWLDDQPRNMGGLRLV